VPDQSPSYNDEATPGASVWPPPPTGSIPELNPSGTLDPEFGFRDVRAFKTQNPFLLWLLLIVTLDIYSPIWMLRTAKVLNRVWPEKSAPTGVAWVGLGLTIANLLFALTMGVMGAITPSNASAFDDSSKFLGYVVGAYMIYARFQYRRVLNDVLRQTAPGEEVEVFIPGYTFFFGVLYFQIHLNGLIKAKSAKALRRR